MAFANNENQQDSALKKVINVTGTVIHTNLGRSILGREAIRNVERACASYVSLEYDLESGDRGHRDNITEGLIRKLTGCEASIVVNNNAAAVLMCLNTLSRDREVIVSRGELIEIGGSFRLPEVMKNSGAILHEVGASNITYIDDYREAINENTALLMKAHTSNYRIEGSTNSVDISEIVALGKEYGIPVVEDLGSGALIDLSQYGLPKEPTVSESISAGADIVTFSGDKLLGGPQAGLIAGRIDLISKIRRNPLMRCVRVGKMTLSALEATLMMYINGMERNIPTIAYLIRPLDEINAVAEELSLRLAKILDGIAIVSTEEGNSEVGSGSMPAEPIKSRYVTLEPISVSVDKLAELFRGAKVPVIGRISEGKMMMDMRVINEDDMAHIINAAESVMSKIS